MRSEMEIEIRELGLGRVEIRPAGRLVEETVAHLHADLLDSYEGSAAVLLNLSRLSEIDAAGMALVLLARVEREAMGGRLVVESANPAITKCLVAAGMNGFVRLEKRRIDALRVIGADQRPKPANDRLPEVARRRFWSPSRSAPSSGGGVAAVYAR